MANRIIPPLEFVRELLEAADKAVDTNFPATKFSDTDRRAAKRLLLVNAAAMFAR